MRTASLLTDVTRQTKMAVGEMHQALKQERRAARDAGLQFSITGARHLFMNDRLVLDIELRLDHGAMRLPSHEIELGRLQLTDGTWHGVELIEQTKAGVRAVAAEPIDPAKLVSGTLEIDQSWLLDRQMKVMLDVVGKIDSQKPHLFRYDLALAALNHPEIHVAPPKPLAVDLDLSAKVLNERQMECLERSARAGVSLIWGPPGTGKSRTLVEIAVAHALVGERVLVVTPSNATADQLSVGCLQRYEPLLGAAYDSHVIRWGRRVKELSSEERSCLMLDVVAESRANQYLHALRTAPTIAPKEFVAATLPEKPTPASLAFTTTELFANAHIVVCPIAQLYLCPDRFMGMFDTLLIDEASMMVPPTIWLASGYARRRVVIAGDPSQLGAPLSTTACELRHDVFRRHGADPSNEADSGVTWTMLTEQHRMTLPICEFVSDAFYGGRLRTAPGTTNRLRPIEWPFDPDAGGVLVIDTSTETRTSTARGSNAVHEHALLATELGIALVDPANTSSLNSVLLLSPYRAQVAQMRAMLKEGGAQGGGSPPLKVSTIHAAQGSEADAVILTLDDAPEAPSFLSANRQEGCRLLNVAISRSRRGILIIGPVERLARSTHVGREVRQTLQALLDSATVRLVSDIGAVAQT